MAGSRSESVAAPTSAGLRALLEHELTASVQDLDHYRTHKMTVETDYIVEVDGSQHFETFTISKTYAQFRLLTQELKELSESSTAAQSLTRLSDADLRLAKACNLCWHLIESQPTEYLGKVSYTYVKGLAKQRQSVINDVLQQLLEQFPNTQEFQESRLGPLVGDALEIFFLTDHCEMQRKSTMSHTSSDQTNTLATGETSRHRTGEDKRKTASSAVDRLNPMHWHLEKTIIGKGVTKLGSGLGSGISTVTSGVGSGLSTVTTGVGTVVRKMDITSAFCATENPKAITQRTDGAGGVRDSQLIPMTTKSRHVAEAADLEKEIDEPIVMEETIQGEEEIFSPKKPGTAGQTMELGGKSVIGAFQKSDNVPFLLAAGAVVLAVYIKVRSRLVFFTLDSDIAMVGMVGAFFLGLHFPQKPTSRLTERRTDKTRAMMKRTSMFAPASGMSPVKRSLLLSPADLELEEEEVGEILESPLPMFPKGAKIGSHNNCWSVPDYEGFQVRGPKYLEDRKKVASQEFLFPTRGIDLFLTDTCPENVGSFCSVFGGNLRTVPTFIINFRLPWGVLIFYFEIPAKFIPFVRAGYEPDFDKSTLPDVTKMTPSERTACRFLMSDLESKNKCLKIVPVVVDGPWIVKNVVGGKPAIIGNKLPVNYVYQPAQGDKALYLEADLDIAASSAARGILSVTRSYTEILTIDLGFVVQGNQKDELPEQMLVGCRIHGVDPLTAQQLPMQSMSILMNDDNESSALGVDGE